MIEKITVPEVVKMKQRGEKITCLTAYDYSFARILDEAGVDILLVGDSLGCVVQGRENTLPVTLDEIIYHTRAVTRGRTRALVVADMPFLSYQVSKEQAVQNAGRLLQEARAEAVVLEGMPKDLAAEITGRLSIPTIGIGAGVQCDGQVLVIHDMLGLFQDFTPKFVKRYADLKGVITSAVKDFVREVREEKFPGEEHSFK